VLFADVVRLSDDCEESGRYAVGGAPVLFAEVVRLSDDCEEKVGGAPVLLAEALRLRDCEDADRA
jgi:hypothetical protein